MDPQLFCLRWNNHQSNLLSTFDHLLQLEAFCDVTLAVDGASLKCHKMVLAACSNYFQELFMDNTCKHPIVFLKDVSFNQTKALLDYMYHGEVSVQEEELQGLLKIAEALQVKGLVESDDNLAAAAAAKKKTPSGGSNSGKLVSQLAKNPVRPVNTAKLMSPKVRNENGDDEDPGHLVIDEESNSIEMSPLEPNYEIVQYNDDIPPAPGMVKHVLPNGKIEWKRYKQYTKDDILAAIEEVKNGMSALQASRKYGVPSRTLYDKVKKMGILTANMQKQLQQKKETPGSNNGTPSKPMDPANFNPISLLGMQLPQTGLTPDGKNNGDLNLTSPFMLSMIEKIKAAGLNKAPLGDTPLNLSAMLDSNNTNGGHTGHNGGHSGHNGGHNGHDAESEGENSRSVSSESGESITIKQETILPEAGGDTIRAQFFADLKRLNPTETTGMETDSTSTSSSQHSVTLKAREATDQNGEDNLPPRKRKVDVDEAGDCKKKVHEDDLEQNIKLETTSC